jgi:hypothetical protein
VIEDKIKTVLHYQILNICFNPINDKELFGWLTIFINQLGPFWQLDDFPGKRYKGCEKYKFHAEFTSDALDIECKIKVDNLFEFSVEILHLNEGKKDLILRHEAHPKHGSDFLLPHTVEKNERIEALRNVNSDHIADVVDYMLLHPYVHTHIKGPVTPENHIRLGGGISNALQYLFHLRYQLCPEEIRQPKTGPDRHPERSRLIALLEGAIGTDKTTISPTELMCSP